MAAGDAAVRVTLTLASNNNSLLNDIFQTTLPPQAPGQRPTITSDVLLDYPPQYVPPEGIKSLSATTLQERERTPCFHTPPEGVRTPCIQTPQEGEKTPCFHTPQEGEKTPCSHTPQKGVKTPCSHTPQEGGKDSLCTVSYCIYPRSSSKEEEPNSGKQAKIFPASVENLRRTPFNSKPDCRRIQATLQGVPKIAQDSLHNQRLRRLQQTKCLVDCYSRLTSQRRNRHHSKTRQSRFLQSPIPGPKTRQPLEASNRPKLPQQVSDHMKVQDGDPESIRASLRKNEWVTSIDLTDTYLHIPIHPQSQKYLWFHYKGVSYQFTSLPFGLATAPLIFTSVVKVRLLALTTGNTHSSIPRRLADSRPLQGGVPQTDPKDVKPNSGFGVCGEIQEVRTGTFPEVRFSRVPFFTRFGACQTHSRQVDEASGYVPSPLVEICYQCKDSYVHHWITCINGEDSQTGQDAYETFSMASQNSQELESEDDTTRGMVVRPQKRATRRVSPPKGTRKTDLYRRLKRRLGHTLRSRFNRRGLVSHGKELHINLLEMKAVFLALQFFKTTCKNNRVLIASDNTSVVSYINKQGGTRSAELCALMWRILTWCNLNNVTLRARHVPGSLNVIADGLSRRNQIQSTEWSLSPQVFKQIFKIWESPQVDLFATRLNTKLPLYVSPIPDPQAWAVDALNIPWENLVAYAFPPTALLPKVVQKLQSQMCRLLLIAPGWPSKPWFWDLVEMSLDVPRRLPQIRTLLKQPMNNLFHSNPASLNLHVWYLGAQHCNNEGSLQRWQRELLLLRDSQQEPSTPQSGLFSKDGAWNNRWTSESLYRGHLQFFLVSLSRPKQMSFHH